MIRGALGWFLVVGIILCIPVSLVVQAATDNSAAGIAFGWAWFALIVVAYLILRRRGPRADQEEGPRGRRERGSG